MKNHSCCFTGHREITDDYSELKKRLERELVELIKQGIYIFYSGGASGFDLFASESILELKKIYPHMLHHFFGADILNFFKITCKKPPPPAPAP